MRQVAVVTTGFFDGVHLGHRHVIETVVSSARERGEEAIVVTFWPHPRTVLQQDARELRILNTLEEKKALLSGLGVDRVEVLPFTRDFAALTAAQYLQLLHDKFGASLIIMGYDNKIGSDRVSAEGMHRFGNDTYLQLQVVNELSSFAATGSGKQHASISSTIIRKSIIAGDVAGANEMLGYEYTLTGAVVAGNRMGRTIGFPTANMQVYEPLKLVPGNGVYAVEAQVLGSTFKGMCNIGVRPTVSGVGRTIETHILDFSEDIYGLPLTVRFLRRIRDERKFSSLEDLRAQLILDRAAL